jgi:phosphomannomutase
MNKTPLIVSISGLRGIVGQSLTPEVIVRYAAAFAEYSGRGKIVIGRDGRITGKSIGNILSSTLISMGCDVVALGVAPTPTIALAVERYNASGGIAVTASHNPVEWNGLKFISNSGMFLNEKENKRLWKIADSSTFAYATWDKLGTHTADESFLRRHIDEVLSLPVIQSDLIKRRRFRVAVDCINASGSVIVPQILRELGCDVIGINTDLTGIFSRTPEPIPENLGPLCECVRKNRADFGIAVDPDADRLVIVTEQGKPLGEEYTITTAVKIVLEKEKKKNPVVVVNLSTTRAVDDVAKRSGARIVRTPVGEINVAQKMKDLGAVIGGEGSGGVILPKLHYTRDAIVGIGLFLQQMAEFDGTLSQFKETLPHYSIVKTKIRTDSIGRRNIFARLIKYYSNRGAINSADGLKIDLKDSWIHLRKSNTEPIIRIIAEAVTEKEAGKLIREVRQKII